MKDKVASINVYFDGSGQVGSFASFQYCLNKGVHSVITIGPENFFRFDLVLSLLLERPIELNGLVTSHDSSDDIIDFRVEGCAAPYFKAGMAFPDLSLLVRRDFIPLLTTKDDSNKLVLRSKIGIQRYISGRKEAHSNYPVHVHRSVSGDQPVGQCSLMLSGWSRGACTASLVAKELHRRGVNNEIHIFAREPIPGTPTPLIPLKDLTACDNVRTVSTFFGAAKNPLYGRGLVNIFLDLFFMRQQVPRYHAQTAHQIIACFTHGEGDPMRDDEVETNIVTPADLQRQRGISRSALFALARLEIAKDQSCTHLKDQYHNDSESSVFIFKRYCYTLRERLSPTGRLNALIELMQYRADIDDKKVSGFLTAILSACRYSSARATKVATGLLTEAEFKQLHAGNQHDDNYPNRTRNKFYRQHDIYAEYEGSHSLCTATAISTAAFSLLSAALCIICISQVVVSPLVPILMLAAVVSGGLGVVSMFTSIGSGIFHDQKIKQQAKEVIAGRNASE